MCPWLFPARDAREIARLHERLARSIIPPPQPWLADTRYDVLTDDNGVYAIDALLPASYGFFVWAVKDGYEPDQQRSSVDQDFIAPNLLEQFSDCATSFESARARLGSSTSRRRTRCSGSILGRSSRYETCGLFRRAMACLTLTRSRRARRTALGSD